MVVQATFEELRIAYDDAFERLRSEVRLLNAFDAQRDPRLLDDRMQRVRDAELLYRQMRDDLADFIIERQPRALAAAHSCC
jgi:hypothetical protein